tara:strand:- start:510 stop:875 length:366 start_codon:yes stop_codon:yes gene_type:complete
MALSLVGVVANAGATHAIQTDATSTVDVLKAGSGTLYKVEINNTTNSSPVYVKLWLSTGSITVGTTDPHYVFKCPASVTRSYSCPKGAAFATGLKAACVTTGGTAGTSNPTNDVIYRILFS